MRCPLTLRRLPGTETAQPHSRLFAAGVMNVCCPLLCASARRWQRRGNDGAPAACGPAPHAAARIAALRHRRVGEFALSPAAWQTQCCKVRRCNASSRILCMRHADRLRVRENVVATRAWPKLMHAAACAAALFKRARLRTCGHFHCLPAIHPARMLSTHNTCQQRSHPRREAVQRRACPRQRADEQSLSTRPR